MIRSFVSNKPSVVILDDLDDMEYITTYPWPGKNNHINFPETMIEFHNIMNPREYIYLTEEGVVHSGKKEDHPASHNIYIDDDENMIYVKWNGKGTIVCVLQYEDTYFSELRNILYRGIHLCTAQK